MVDLSGLNIFFVVYKVMYYEVDLEIFDILESYLQDCILFVYIDIFFVFFYLEVCDYLWFFFKDFCFFNCSKYFFKEF